MKARLKISLHRCIFIFSYMVLVFSASMSSADDDYFDIRGVNRPHLEWLDENSIDQIIENMQRENVRRVRVTVVPPGEKSLTVIKKINANNIGILSIIGVGDRAYYPEDGSAFRSSYGRTWDAARLSKIDLSLFRTYVRSIFDWLDHNEIRLIGVQVGNEINWAHFNGDLKIFPSGNVRVARALDLLSDWGSFLRGIDNYISSVRIIKEETSRTKYNSSVPVILSGFAKGDFDFADRVGFEVVSPSTMIRELKIRGIDDLVDHYAVHIYPSTTSGSVTLQRYADRGLEICGSPPKKTCWITEWGFVNNESICPVADVIRAKAVREMKSIIDAASRRGSVSAAYYFDWDKNSRYSIWRCNGLTPAGREIFK